jgi:hypothetical protein
MREAMGEAAVEARRSTKDRLATSKFPAEKGRKRYL